MNALVASVIRTILPIAVGQVASWLLLLHIVLPEPAMVGLSAFLGGLLSAIYYVGVRVLEQQWPYVGILLGLPSSPDTYSKSTVTAAIPAAPTTAGGPVTIISGPVPSGIVPDLPATEPVAVSAPAIPQVSPFGPVAVAVQTSAVTVPIPVPAPTAPELATPAQ